MLQRRLITMVAPLALGVLVLAACGEEKENTGGSGDNGGSKKTVKIGFIAPLSGDLSALGAGMKNSVQLAIDQANKANKVEGYTIVLAAEDDQAKADVGAQVAAKLASDNEVAAVIGTLNSSVAQQVQPILHRAGIPMVSPANTNPSLTQGANYATSKERQFDTYFRVATTDAIQGPFAANFVSNDLKFKKAVIIHDKKTYGQGLAAEFEKQFTKNGGAVVGRETINAGDRDFSAVISKIKPLGAEVVYYGGEYPESAPLSKQMKQNGLNIPLIGGDGMYSGKYLEIGGAQVESDYATSVGAPTEQLDTAKQFVADYTAAKFKEPYEAYGAYSYDSANVIIDALAEALDGDKTIAEARKDIVDAIQETDLDGTTGEVKFDEFGDNTTKTLTVYKVVSGAWKPEKVGELE